MSTSIQGSVKQNIEEQVSRGGYSSASEFGGDLVCADHDQQATQALEQSLLAAIEEGDAQEATPEWWQSLRAEVAARTQARDK